MPSDELILELVDLVYEAAGNPGVWPAFLTKLSEAMGARTAQFSLVDVAVRTSLLAETIGFDPTHFRNYQAHYYNRDVWCTRAPKSYFTEGFIGASHQICPDKELEQTEFYNDFLRPQGLYYGMTGVVLKNETQGSAISIVRDEQKGPCLDAEQGFLKRLLPHLQRAVALHQRITALECDRNSAHEVLDHVAFGLLLLGAKGKVLLANRRARAVLDKGDGIALDRGCLRASLSLEDRRLQVLIQGALGAGPSRSLHPGGAMTLTRRIPRQPLSVLVTPLRGARSWFGPSAVQAAIFVGDPETENKGQDGILTSLFGLTPAECRVALLLGQGKSVQEVSGQLGVSRNTLKTQIASVYSKTGVARQSQLVRLLMQFPLDLSTGSKS